MAQNFMPYVVVFASASATQKLRENNLTPAEFLRPFGNVGNLNNCSVKTCEKHEPFKLSNFRVNFIDSGSMVTDPRTSAKIVDSIFKT